MSQKGDVTQEEIELLEWQAKVDADPMEFIRWRKKMEELIAKNN